MLHIIQRTFSFLDSYVLLDLSPQTIQRYSHAGKTFQANIPIFYPVFRGYKMGTSVRNKCHVVSHSFTVLKTYPIHSRLLLSVFETIVLAYLLQVQILYLFRS